MYAMNNQTSVLLQFRGMTSPVEVTLPKEALRYLDQYATRLHTPDGNVIYQQPHPQGEMSERNFNDNTSIQLA